MPDWTAYVKAHLRLRGFRPEREAEIVEEVARQLEDAYAEAQRLGSTEEHACRTVEQHVSDWTALAKELEESHRGKETAMTLWQQNKEDHDLRARGRISWLTDMRHDV